MPSKARLSERVHRTGLRGGCGASARVSDPPPVLGLGAFGCRIRHVVKLPCNDTTRSSPTFLLAGRSDAFVSCGNCTLQSIHC
jgi:hypothetical protein